MRNKSRKTRVLTAFAIALIALSAFAATASALPARFWGVVPQGGLTTEQLQRLEKGGVQSLRVPLIWSSVQPTRGSALQWASFDEAVEETSKANIEILPFAIGTPTWAVPLGNIPGGGGAKAPAHLPATGTAAKAWSKFLKAAVARYGPGGEFWTSHPTLQEVPINNWQIWNEPNFKYFVAKPNPTEYGKLVKLSATAIRSQDASAKVILAGMFSQPAGGRRRYGTSKKIANSTSANYFAAYFLEQMYKTNPGIRSSFNGVALHPYVPHFNRLKPEIEEFRNVLKANGDASKGLWITELGWSSEPPQGPSNVFAVGQAGQARELKGAFTLLKKEAVKFRLQRIFWFSVDDAPETCNFCNGSGLFKKGFIPKKAWTEYVKFAGGTP